MVKDGDKYEINRSVTGGERDPDSRGRRFSRRRMRIVSGRERKSGMSDWGAECQGKRECV